jgi:hypothetical protein
MIKLQGDIKKYYWQSIFVFGKMGDKAVPFLLKYRIGSKKQLKPPNCRNIDFMTSGIHAPLTF